MALNLFVPLDVDYQFDPKIIAAGVIGEALFNRSLALSKRTLSDGKIHSTQLAGLCLGMPGKPSAHAATLVSVGLWQTTTDGWIISAWAKRNATAKSVIDKTARKKASALKANHERWHVGAGTKPSDTCPLCYPDSIRLGSDSESTEEEVETEPQEDSKPEAEPPSSSSSGQQSSVGDPIRTDDDDLAMDALRVFAERMAHQFADPTPRARSRYAQVTIENGEDHLPELRRLAAERPDAEPEVVATAYDLGSWHESPASADHPPNCECDGNGWVDAGNNAVKRCEVTEWPDATIHTLRATS